MHMLAMALYEYISIQLEDSNNEFTKLTQNLKLESKTNTCIKKVARTVV